MTSKLPLLIGRETEMYRIAMLIAEKRPPISKPTATVNIVLNGNTTKPHLNYDQSNTSNAISDNMFRQNASTAISSSNM